jgi:hypothetical protein
MRARVLVSLGAGFCLSASLIAGCGTSAGDNNGGTGSSSSSSGGNGSSSGKGGSTSSGGAGSSGSSGSSGSGGSSSGNGVMDSGPGMSGDDGGSSGADADAGTGPAEDGACTPYLGNGVGSNDAGFGCSALGTDMTQYFPPGFCDNGIREMPPTCNPTVDALLNMTPLADMTHPCKVPANNIVYSLNDPSQLGMETSRMCKLNGAVYWVSDENIDCDGITTDPTKCPGQGINADPSHQNQTSYGIDPNTGGILPSGNTTNSFDSAHQRYVVIPLDASNMFAPGTVVAVIYRDHLSFAVFADQGPAGQIGEGSYAQMVENGGPPSPALGGISGRVVTYIAFTGSGTVPAKVNDFSSGGSVDTLGTQLVQQLIQNNP